MPWLAWIVLGVVLLAVELTLVDAQFYLLFVGVSATLVGLLGLIGVGIPDWLQWVVFAALSVVALTIFRRKIYDMTRVHGDRVTTGPTGEEVTVPARMASGETCRVEFRGSTWSALNTGEHVIPADARAQIVGVDGLTLHIRSIKH
jgi:inner membrane protein